MVMTIQEISDRFEIMDLQTDYCTAIGQLPTAQGSRLVTERNAPLEAEN
jgi:hypothetical protein